MDNENVEPTLSERQEAFLEVIAAGGRDPAAAEAAGVHRVTAYRWKKHDPEFKARYDTARQVRLDHLVKEAERRAMNGSDRLLEFLLCNYAPDKFSNKQKVEHSGDIGIAERLARARKRTSTSDDGSDLAG